ncbi:tRNA pseudouridine synthase B [Paraphoma chrysanthemicola]|uniref:tRNA pseudouridine(55) synthase n=1 Tax=Paraphoma chrysanthemicola TaxID=798071 RepID=A0A8K0VTC5_9PLEO|nr:tRNA pseudouridine synthase B [Paraphoma chrysanthemicola]
MDAENEAVLEGVFAVAKPAHVSSADVLQKLQATFADSRMFAPLLKSQPQRPSKSANQVFKMGHGGTLDPLASGVLIVGIGRGTKYLQEYLACTKTYETVVLFGASTDTYDCTGTVAERADYEHVTLALVQSQLERFRGKIMQAPPIYSALKINGVKACEYARQGKQLPRELEEREMFVDECTLLEWYEGGHHSFNHLEDEGLSQAPAARIRLNVCSGFYVRSFAHYLGIACSSRSHMASLDRTRQADYTIAEASSLTNLTPTLTYPELEAGEHIWEAKLRPQLEAWVAAHPVATGHVNGRDEQLRRKAAEEKEGRPRQRFRGEWLADTKRERIKQQGGKYKGKWGRKTAASSSAPTGIDSPEEVVPAP